MKDEKLKEKKIFGWKSYEFTMMTLFFFAWGFVFLNRLDIVFMSPLIISEMGLTNIQVGYFGTVTTLCFAFSSIFVGMLSDRSGLRKRWLIPVLFGTAIFSALGAIAPDFTTLLLTRAGVGLFAGPALPLMLAMMAKESSKGKFGLNSGIINTGVALIATTIAPILLTQVAGWSNWRMAFLVASIPTLIVGFIMLKTIKEVKVEPSPGVSAKGSGFKNFAEVLKYRNVVLCFLIGMCSMAGYWTLLTFGPLYWDVVGGFELGTIGMIIAAMGFIGIFYAFMIPKISDNIGRKPTLLIFYFLSFIVPLSMFFFPNSTVAVVIFCIFAAIPGCMTPLFMAVIPTETLPESLSGTAQGLILGFAEIVGGALWVIFVGMLADTQGLPVAMLSGAAVLLIAVILSAFLIETNTKEKRAEVKKMRGKGN